MHRHIFRIIGVLHTEVQALEGIQDSDGDLAAAIASLRTASAAIVTRQAARDEAERKAVAHREIVPRCRAAVDLIRKLEREYTAGIAAAGNAQLHSEFCESELVSAKNAGLPSYPKDAEIRAQAEFVERLRGEAVVTRGDLVKAVATRDRLGRELVQAREELGKLEFQERILRPRTESKDLRVASIG
jgi:hypothetical protein